MSYVLGLRCLSCKAEVNVTPFRYLCPHCDGYLDVEYDYARMAKDLSPRDFDGRRGSVLQQWLEFLPIERPDLIPRVTLGERPTPMIRAGQLVPTGSSAELWLKNEAQSPTCSLKDRSMPLAVLKALELGRDSVGIVSSGNASASLAAYAARAGLRAVVFIVAHASKSKLYKTMIYRPTAIQVQGEYEATERLFQQARDEFGFLDCDGLINPYRAEGKKSFAYEAARDFGWNAPDAVLIPTGYGNGIVAAWKGFKELHRLGFIRSLPAMIAVQPLACAPIVRAFDKGLSVVEPVEERKSVAEAVSLANPSIGGQRVLEAIRESGGLAIAVDEDEILSATRMLPEKEGMTAEPAGATGVAAALKLIASGHALGKGRLVVSVTGHGLNDVETGSRLAPSPARVDADYEAVRRALTAGAQAATL